MKSWQQTFLLGAGFGVAFLLGQFTVSPAGAARATVEAQGRGPTNPAPAPEPTPTAAGAAVVVPEDGGQSASGNGFVAVTGSYGVGTSVLYLLDTTSRQLAVYEARGGSSEQRRLVLVGARRIDLDLKLEGYNDHSEYQYQDLRKLFERRGRPNRDVQMGFEGQGTPK